MEYGEEEEGDCEGEVEAEVEAGDETEEEGLDRTDMAGDEKPENGSW